VLFQAITRVAFFALSRSFVGQHGALRSIHFLAWSYNTSYVRIGMLFNIVLQPSWPPASPCHSLSHGFTRRAPCQEIAVCSMNTCV
jgi:hypothetical protein